MDDKFCRIPIWASSSIPENSVILTNLDESVTEDLIAKHFEVQKQRDMFRGALLDLLINNAKRGVDGYSVEDSLQKIKSNKELLQALNWEKYKQG